MKKLIIKVLISSIFIFLVLRQVDFQATEKLIRNANPFYFVLMIILILINYLVSTLRWKKLYKGNNEPNLKYFLKLYFKGSFFNNFLPTSIGGDSYKIFKLGKTTGDKVNSFTSVFMDRFTGFIMLILISYIGVLFTWNDWVRIINDIVKSTTLTYLLLFLSIVGFWIASFLFFVFLKTLAPKVSFIQKLYNALKVYSSSRELLVYALLTSVVVQICAVLTQYFAYLSVGVTPNFFYAMSVIPVITLAGFFIPSINGIGIQDFLYMNLFSIVGISNPISLGASLLYHFFRLIVSLVGGLFYAIDKE